MSDVMKISILFGVFLLFGCGGGGEPLESGKNPVIGEPYQSECLDGSYDEAGDSVEVHAWGDTIRVVDRHAEFNCCLDAWMEVSIEGTDITVVEREDPDKTGACYCICPFELSIQVSSLADGLYLVRVYREDFDGNTLLHEQDVRIPVDDEPECIQDEDCPDGYVCRMNVCLESPPIDPCLEAGGNCLVTDPDGCPDGSYLLGPPDPFICGGGGGVMCCVPGCLSDSDCGPGEECESGNCVPVADCVHHDDCGPERMCVEGACVDVTVECIDHTGYCFPVEAAWACQCYEQGESRLCHETDLADPCSDALDACCAPGCQSDEDCSWNEVCLDGRCVLAPECTIPADCLGVPWEVYCLGHWVCAEGQCQEVCDMEACGDGVCDSQGGESEGSCPPDCAGNPECETHEDCLGRTDTMQWCIQGECLPGETPCQAAGGSCTCEAACPDGTFPVNDPSTMHCAFCGHCCLAWGCPDLISCPVGMTCSGDGTCQP